MTNVVKLDAYRRSSSPAPPSPTQPAPPWHSRTADWCLFWLQAEPEIISLEPHEIKFLRQMLTDWPWDPTDRQAAWLVRLARKVEKRLIAEFGAPPDAA